MLLKKQESKGNFIRLQAVNYTEKSSKSPKQKKQFCLSSSEEYRGVVNESKWLREKMYKNKTIAVVIPAYNEETKIGNVIETMPTFVDYTIVVNDGSTDKTADIAKAKGVIVLTHKKNKGVGAAIATGIRKALMLNIDIMVNIDADGQFNPQDIIKLINPIITKQADFVTGSRFKDPDYYPQMSKIKFIGNKIMSYLISRITGQKFYDVSCGFRAYSKESLIRLNLFGDFTYTQETFLDLTFKGISIVEIPIKVRGTREHGKSKVASNLFKYGWKTLNIILKSFRDYKPFKLFLTISVVNFLIGIGFGTFLLIHYINTGIFSPHKWAGFISGFFILLSLLTIGIGFIVDMFARMRYNQEEMLYLLKEYSFKKD